LVNLPNLYARELPFAVAVGISSPVVVIHVVAFLVQRV